MPSWVVRLDCLLGLIMYFNRIDLDKVFQIICQLIRGTFACVFRVDATIRIILNWTLLILQYSFICFTYIFDIVILVCLYYYVIRGLIVCGVVKIFFRCYLFP